MVVCMADHYYASQVSSADSRKAFLDGAKPYCEDAIHGTRG